MILRFKDDEDIWHDKVDDVEKVFLDYFQDIFTIPKPFNMELIFQTMDNKVTVEMNEALDMEFTRLEIK